jgi:hypothetical protein
MSQGTNDAKASAAMVPLVEISWQTIAIIGNNEFGMAVRG